MERLFKRIAHRYTINDHIHFIHTILLGTNNICVKKYF